MSEEQPSVFSKVTSGVVNAPVAGLRALGIGKKKKPATEEDEVPKWHRQQQPLSEEEAQELEDEDDEIGSEGGSTTSKPRTREAMGTKSQKAVNSRLQNDAEAQEELAAMRAQEQEAAKNPAIALGPNPLSVGLADMPAGARLPADDAPIEFYFKRKGYNDFLILDGPTKTGPCVYFGDVSAKVMGWDITMRKGSDRNGEPLIHIGKARMMWDKGAKVFLTDARPGAYEFSPSELDNDATFDNLTPEQMQQREEMSPDVKEEDPELQAAKQQASLAAMGLGPSAGGQADQRHDSSSSMPTQQPPPRRSDGGYQGPVTGPLTRSLATPPDKTQSELGGSEGASSASARTSRGAWLPGQNSGSREPQEPAWSEDAKKKEKAGETWKRTKDYVGGNFVSKNTVHGRAGPQPLAVLEHLHYLSGNQNIFKYGGRTYMWNWMRFLGAKHTLVDVETNEVVAVGQLHFTFAWQWVTAWGFRLNGTLSITGQGKEFVDIVLASFIAILEWRKHNNKIWQIIIWTAA